MYQSEEIFIDKFLACLIKLNVSQIPFDNQFFYNGIEKMKSCFENKRDFIGDISKEVAMLFLVNPYEGVYSRFRDAISNQNGWYISFQNPEYTIGTLKLKSSDANKILNNGNMVIDLNILMDMAKEFCRGAEIEFSA